MAVLTPQPKMQFTTAAGVPLSGGKVYTYIAGTTTPQATFTDYTGATPNPNPVILDSRGEANIWLGGALYKFKLTDVNDVEIWTVDYISAPTSAVSPILSGNVTIDSDTPTPALKITQTGTGPVMRVQDSADPDTTPFIIDNAGNVGIGTAVPAAALDVAVNSAAAAVRITQTGAGNSFRVDDEANPDASPFLITGAGDVGVGVTAPTAKMDVRGDVLATNGTNGVRLVSSEGALELKRSTSDAYIDFKTSAAEDADCRIAQLNNGLAFQVGGNGALVGGATILSDARFQFNSGYGSVATAFGCRAWVNFNGQGTVSIRASGNVSSITDNGAGDYTVNFTVAMPDANYAVVGQSGQDGVGVNRTVVRRSLVAGSVRILNYNASSGALDDDTLISVAIFR